MHLSRSDLSCFTRVRRAKCGYTQGVTSVSTRRIGCLDVRAQSQERMASVFTDDRREHGARTQVPSDQRRERERDMKEITSMPLPLALAQPVAMASDLETLLTEKLSPTYDSKTQLGAPEMWNHGGRGTSSNCVNFGLIQVDDVVNDISL